jgi:hypothetical protein
MQRVFITLLLTALCRFTMAQKADIVIFNKTGFDLDSLMMSKIYIGKLQKDSSLKIYPKNPLELQSGLPIYNISAKVDGRVIAPKPLRCAKGIQKNNSGTLLFDIRLYKGKDQWRFYWEKHL